MYFAWLLYEVLSPSSEHEVFTTKFETADRVFGPATTTRHVYDVAARHVVEGAMHGVNGENMHFISSSLLFNFKMDR